MGDLLGIVGQAIRHLGQLSTIGADGIDVEAVRVPVGPIGCVPVVVTGEHNALAIRRTAGSVIPAESELCSFAGTEVKDVQAHGITAFHIEYAVYDGGIIRGPGGVTGVVSLVSQVGVAGSVALHAVNGSGGLGTSQVLRPEAGNQLSAVGVPRGLEATCLTFLKPQDFRRVVG